MRHSDLKIYSEIQKFGRVEWIDIARALGIYEIYLGHFATDAGRAYEFVFKYHVALFFFISGCMDTYNEEVGLFEYLIKKIKTVLIPFYIFAATSVVFQAICYDTDLWGVIKYMLEVAKGCVRNSFFAGSLWFLSCLFIMEIAFRILKYLKYKPLILLICVGMYFIRPFFSPSTYPSLYYNIDSLYYIAFFALGYFLYPYMCVLFEHKGKKGKMIYIVLMVFSFLYSTCLFFDIDLLEKLIPFLPPEHKIASLIKTLILIVFHCSLSRMLCGMRFLREIGRNSLFLCGNEWIVKNVVVILLELFGLTIRFANPVSVYLYVAILIGISIKVLIPIEKGLIYIIKANLKEIVLIRIV